MLFDTFICQIGKSCLLFKNFPEIRLQNTILKKKPSGVKYSMLFDLFSLRSSIKDSNLEGLNFRPGRDIFIRVL